jgi:hypothetical protein
MVNHRTVALVALACAAVPATATTLVVDSGTRIQTMSFAGGVFGQSFIAPGTDLQSIGVQFATLNPTAAQDSVTITVREGAGLTGAVLGSSTIVPVNVGRNDPKVFTDIDFTGVTLVSGASYTFTLVNNGSGPRNGILFGPSLIDPPFGQVFGPDAYADGDLLFSGSAFSPCRTLDRCDLNFRVTATTAVIPEPASWALMIAGFGLVGGTLRRRAQQAA